MWKRAQPEEPNTEDLVADECEAYLRGEWAEYRRARGEAVPGWAWINRVAHAPVQALRLMRPRSASPQRTVDGWAEFRSAVTEGLFRRADETGTAVEELQAAVLVPIELALFSLDESQVPADVAVLMRILAALRHPSTAPGGQGE